MLANHSTALITGGARRIGAACVQALARQKVSVVIHYQTARLEALALQEQIESQGGEAHILEANLADPDHSSGLLQQAEAMLGGRPITILINNAAIFVPGSIRECSFDQWQNHLAINLTAPFLLMQSFARRLPKNMTGRIINMIDQHGDRPRPGYAAYAAAKSALWTLTRQAALELAPFILVNAIGPGPILPAYGSSVGEFEQIANATPLQRSGTTDDITETMLFLLSHPFITGEMICVDGGEHLN